MASIPFHPPEATHAVALADTQVSVDAAPEATAAGVALRVTVGAGGAGWMTVTVAEAGALVPPSPAQLSEKLEFTLNAPVLCVPEGASVPLHAPEAVHEDALVELQLSVDAAPEFTVLGSAASRAVGAGAAVTVIATLAG